MRWRALLGVLALAGVSAAADCADEEFRNAYNNKYVPWLRDVAVAVCELETKHSATSGAAALDPAKRICPNGLGGGGDKTGVPPFPPP